MALVYADYILRAMRWKIMLRPACPEANTCYLVAPTMIGFAGLALLGGRKFIRPYLISRKVNLSMASQLAVWTVGPIFDMGAFAFTAISILWSRDTSAGFRVCQLSPTTSPGPGDFLLHLL